MRAAAIIDTSIFNEFLGIPSKSDESRIKKVLHEFEQLIEDRTSFLLPMATIYETGNHIAKSSGDRFRLAQKFVEYVRQAIKGYTSKIPWIAMVIPTNDEVELWLSEFPQRAAGEVGMADLSIIKEWEKMVEMNPSRRVFIWALDSDLKGDDLRAYDQPPTIK
ncbi:MAG: hypothetical protein J7647_11680 [Cyanobacteria bacterium SBLK]|nr:hypothetical protein [Cyanobacteria bacterium SBLK]